MYAGSPRLAHAESRVAKGQRPEPRPKKRPRISRSAGKASWSSAAAAWSALGPVLQASAMP